MLRNKLILAITCVALASAFAWRGRDSQAALEAAPAPSSTTPRLVELGSDKCASCRAMIPVLAELRETHAATLEVEFIDVWKFPERAEPYHVRVIPTQVFLAPDGSELARHQGFFAAAAIREQWARLGFALEREDDAP